MKVRRKKFVAKLGRPIVALVDHQSSVSMPTTSSIGSIRQTLPFRCRPILFTDIPMKVISRLLDHAIQMWIEVRAVHSSITRVGYNMKQMPNHSVDHEHLPVLVVIKSPRVGSALRYNLELVMSRMVTPDRTVHRDSL